MSSIRTIAIGRATGGGGSSVTVEALSATENKTYTAPSGKAYSPVTVNVPEKTLGTKSIIANGNYPASGDNLDGYSSVSINVPNSYAAGDEGKVVSGGALVAQTARASQITENGEYDTTNNNSVTVNVSGGGGGGIPIKDYWCVGDNNGSQSTSISKSGIVCAVGDLLVVAIMHREAITIDESGWTLLYSYTGGWQYTSVYTKTATSTSESVTIRQSGTGRICAQVIVFSAGTSLTNAQIYEPDDTYRKSFSVASSEKYRLCAINDGYSYGTLYPQGGFVSLCGLTWNSGNRPYLSLVRFGCFIIGGETTYLYSGDTFSGTDEYNNTRLITFDIS